MFQFFMYLLVAMISSSLTLFVYSCILAGANADKNAGYKDDE